MLALAAVALTSGCSDEADRKAMARWAAAYTSQCEKAIANDPSLAGDGPSFCTCVATRYAAKFRAVQLPLMFVSKPLHDAGSAMTTECALIASIEDEYYRLRESLSAHNDLAATAYLAPDFVGTDVRGRDEDAKQMLYRMKSYRKDAAQITTVLSAREIGKRMAVGRKVLEVTKVTVGRKSQTLETLTFFSDTWIDSDGTWLLQRSRVDRIDTYVDGRLASKVTSTGQAR